MGASSYNIYRSTIPNPLDWGDPIATTTVNSFDIPNGGSKYFYHVRTVH